MISKVNDTRIDKPASAPLDAANKNADTTTQPQSPITGRLGTKEVTQLVSSTTDQPQQLSSTEKAEATDAPNSPKNLETRTVSVVDPKADSNAGIPNTASDSTLPGTHASQVTGEELVAPAVCTSDFETQVDPKTAQKELLALYADYKHKEAYDQFVKEHSFSSLEALLDRCIKDGFDINHKNKSGQTFLHVAAVWKDLDLVNILLERKADPNCRTALKNTPLHVVNRPESNLESDSKNLEITKVLIAAGADVNARNYTHMTPLMCVAELGNLDAIKLFFDAGADIEAAEKSFNLSPLHIAVKNGYFEIVKFLVEHKVLIDPLTIYNDTPLRIAATKGHMDIVEFLIQNKANINAIDIEGFSILHNVVKRGQESVVDILLAAGADITLENFKGVTALGIAAYKGFATIVEKLSNTRALIEAQSSKDKFRAIHYATLSGHLEIVKTLVERNAEIDPVDDQHTTPLYIAVSKGYIEIAVFLIENGANINAVDMNGKSILVAAIEHKHEALLVLLIEKGVDFNKADSRGNTPLAYAINHGHPEIAAFLIHSGATLFTVNL